MEGTDNPSGVFHGDTVERFTMKRIPHLTRRRFLRNAATSALVFPTIVPRSVLGADGKAPPSERITVGFIGCGKMANDFHLSTLLNFGDVQALAVCEVDTTRRAHAKRRVEKAYSERQDWKGCADYVDFRELLARGGHGTGIGLEHVARRGAHARLQLHPQPARGSQSFSGVAQLPRILRRRAHGHGRAPL